MFDQLKAKIKKAESLQATADETRMLYLTAEAAYNDQIKDLEKTRLYYESQLELIGKEISAVRVEYDKAYATFLDLLRMSYEQGSANYIEILLGAESFTDLLARIDRVNSLVRYSDTLLKNIDEQKNVLDKKYQQLQKDAEAHEIAIAELEAKTAEIEQWKAENEASLAAIEAEIEELANSIRQNGLMNPITVRPAETDADGNKTYEVIAGGRRIRAHQWLCEHGDDFSLIECCIRTGDKWALQMIENIQRTDLTPREKENAVSKALDEGLTQSQIAEKLSKPIQWVSDIVAGAKIRKIADAAGLNTEEITTKTLSQLRSIPADKLQNCLKELIAEGGTYRAATRMMQEEKNPETTHVSTINENLPNGLYLGVEVDKLGKRLFFKDLLPGKGNFSFFINTYRLDNILE